MTLRLRIACTALVLVVSLFLLDHFMHWMNQPSDLLLYSGLLGVFSLMFLAVPALLTVIWTAGKGRRV
jgi:hypothetical protein